MKTRTFTIIKPDAVSKGYTGKILDMMISAGFVVRAMRMIFMSRNDAVKFYAVHKGKPFFGELIGYMTSGAVVVAVLEREDAVASLRALAGSTDPAKADEGTIRRIFGESLTRNAVHAADNEEHAREEWGQFFSGKDIIDADYTC